MIAPADYAQDLRAFSDRLRDIRFKGAEQLLIDLDELAKDMRSRAAQITARPQPEPVVRGRFDAGIVEDRRGNLIMAEFRRTVRRYR
jgi:hypothetical protein